MKQKLYWAKVVLLMLSVISVMGMTACSFDPKEGTAPEAVTTAVEKSPIAAGDMAEITYRRVTGDEEHPGEAVKVVSASRNDDNESIAESEMLAYITDIDTDKISIDAVEWVTVPSSRADELGIKEEDGPSGFYIYNPDTLTERFTLSADCTITVLDWQNSYETQSISAEKFVAVLQERGEQNSFIPYTINVSNGEITEITEHYVP